MKPNQQLVNHTPQKKWIKNTKLKLKQVYDSIGNLNYPIYMKFMMQHKEEESTKNPDYSASYARWEEHLGFMYLNTPKTTLEATTQLYISSKKYIDSPMIKYYIIDVIFSQVN